MNSENSSACEAAEQINIEDLTSFPSTECDLTGVEVVIDVDEGRVDMTIPEEGVTTTLSAAVEEGAEPIPEVSIFNGGESGIAIAVGDSSAGDAAAVAQLDEQIGSSSRAGTVTGPVMAKCSADAPGVTPNRWSWSQSYAKMGWWYNSSGAPAGAKAAVDAAAVTIDKGKSTTCGNRASRMTLVYDGATSAQAAVSADGGCGLMDGKSVVSYGAINGTVLAWTCTSKALTTIFEADILVDTSNRSWFTGSTGCSGSKYDLQGVMTHEFGHAVGLAHTVNENSGQVMAPITSACNLAWRQLGRGDQNGLLNGYGTE